MADEPDDKPWDPEEENRGENLQREYLELGKEILQDLKAEKEKKVQLDRAAEENLRALRGKMEGAQAFVGAYRTPTYEEVVKRLEVCWAETKRIVGDAPPEVQTAVFHTLMQARSQSEMALEGPPCA